MVPAESQQTIFFFTIRFLSFQGPPSPTGRALDPRMVHLSQVNDLHSPDDLQASCWLGLELFSQHLPNIPTTPFSYLRKALMGIDGAPECSQIGRMVGQATAYRPRWTNFFFRLRVSAMHTKHGLLFLSTLERVEIRCRLPHRNSH